MISAEIELEDFSFICNDKQDIVNDLILDNQNLVIEELMKHGDCLLDCL